MRSCNPCGATAVRRTTSVLSLSAVAAAGLVLLAPGAAKADTIAPAYQSAPLVMSGDRYGATTIPASDDLYVGGLTDDGQILFSAGRANSAGPDLLLQWDSGKIKSIVAPASGSAAEAGTITWPQDVTLDRPVSVNRYGNAVFAVSHSNGTGSWGTFFWNADTQQVKPLALKGMSATGHFVYTQAGGFTPAISDSNEIALVAQVKEPSGLGGYGLFSIAQDGALRPVLLPHQELPGATFGAGHAVSNEFMAPSINDLGEIAYLAKAEGVSGHGAYLWEFDETIPLALTGTGIPGAGTITDISSVSLDREEGNAFITATTDQGGSGLWGLYRVAGRKITAVAAPGTTMPGGGVFKSIQAVFTEENAVAIMAMSGANLADQRVFLATLEDGTAGAYMVDATGRMSLLFQATAQPKPVTIQEIGYQMTFVPGSRPCLNNHGQVALSVRVPGKRSMLVLLTPVQP